jgi:iron complex transport system permease protein
MKSKKNVFVFSILLFFLFFYVNLSFGAVKVSINDINLILLEKLGLVGKNLLISDSTKYIIFDVRLPRIIASYFVGGILAASGAVYQGLMKNPMADPYTLGISSGAAFGATLSIIFLGGAKVLGISSISLAAFIGAVSVVFIVYRIAKTGNEIPVTILLLSGIAISQFLAAFMSILMLLFDESLHKIVFWTMGSLSGKGWSHVYTIIPYGAFGLIILMFFSREMDILLLGDENANNLGVDSNKIKKIILIITSIMTGAAVSISGIIGFVGLIIPHMVRLFTGPEHKYLFPISFNTGGILLMACDTVARTIIPQEIPVGIITALLGGPFFVYLLNKRKGEIF